ncbi:MAG: peptidase S66 [Candidatus Binatia bacterium]|nr:MAG: peptidase S66 [Candidatus Binatia bacterium]
MNHTEGTVASQESPPRNRPQALAPKGCIGIVAPAGAVRRDEIEAGVALLEARGFRVRLGESLWKQFGYLAGTDQERARDLVEMFLDPNVDAIFAARGGYGSARLLPLLDAHLLRAHPKIFVGSSDCTALLQFLVDRCRMVAFHGPVVAAFARREGALDGLVRMLTGEGPWAIRLPRVLHDGAGEGILRGGCLSILVSLLGTPFAPKAEAAVWFFEDVNEKPYRVDRMLTQWGQAGLWAGTTAVVCGEMIGCNGPADSWDVWDVVVQHTAPLGVPVAGGLPSGHGASTCTLPLGIRIRVTRGELEFLEPWVSSP